MTNIPETLDPLQFAYRTNRSTDDAISIALHTALSHLDKMNTYVRMLFTDYSSAFKNIVPSTLEPLGGACSVPSCTPCPLMPARPGTARPDSNPIIKFADDTTVVDH